MVSRIGLGCVTFGREIDEQASIAVLDCALEAGISFFDTAEAYGGGQARAARAQRQGFVDQREVSDQLHSSEVILGRWIGSRGCRDRIVLQTKVAPPLTHRRIIESLEGSLQRLGTSRVDLLLLHAFDPHTPMLQTLEALEDAVASGMASHVGCSNFTAEQLASALELAEQHSLPRLSATQFNYNLAVRDAEQALLPLCRRHHVGVQTYSPLAAGFLCGKYMGGAIPSGSRFDIVPGHAQLYFHRDKFQVAQRLAELSRELQIPAARLAIAWVLSNPAIDTVLIGARTPAHVHNALAALSQEFEPAWLHRIFNEQAGARAGV